jgi:hypothetical protein
VYVLGGKAREKETTRKTKTYGQIILRWILKRQDERILTG